MRNSNGPNVRPLRYARFNRGVFRSSRQELNTRSFGFVIPGVGGSNLEINTTWLYLISFQPQFDAEYENLKAQVLLMKRFHRALCE